MNLGIANITSGNRLKLRGFKLAPQPAISRKVEPAILENKETENKILQPGEFINKLNELFSLELVGADNKLFTKEELYFIDERAGIYEYEAGLSRAEAENRAIKELKNINIYERY